MPAEEQSSPDAFIDARMMDQFLRDFGYIQGNEGREQRTIFDSD
jgi:hypothetical protein